MNRFYFTFGSSSRFPYNNTYLIVIAINVLEAIEKFRNKYPDVDKDIANFSFVYDEKEWKENNMDKYYHKGEAEVIL